jgi:iron complex outermembrane receptor protein
VGGWEREGGTGLSVETYYTGRQPLDDDPYRAESRPYVLVGLLARVRVGRALLFVNGENLGDVRQTRFAPIVRATPGLGGRRTTDVWAPLEGAVVNAGVRLGF